MDFPLRRYAGVSSDDAIELGGVDGNDFSFADVVLLAALALAMVVSP